jgi:hypothetical protein
LRLAHETAVGQHDTPAGIEQGDSHRQLSDQGMEQLEQALNALAGSDHGIESRTWRLRALGAIAARQQREFHLHVGRHQRSVALVCRLARSLDRTSSAQSARELCGHAAERGAAGAALQQVAELDRALGRRGGEGGEDLAGVRILGAKHAPDSR